MADFHVTTRSGERHRLEGVEGWRLMELLQQGGHDGALLSGLPAALSGGSATEALLLRAVVPGPGIEADDERGVGRANTSDQAVGEIHGGSCKHERAMLNSRLVGCRIWPVGRTELAADNSLR